MFRCAACRRNLNERTRTPFNLLEFPTGIVRLVLLWRLRTNGACRISPRCSWSTTSSSRMRPVREHEERFAPLLAERLRATCRGNPRQDPGRRGGRGGRGAAGAPPRPGLLWDEGAGGRNPRTNGARDVGYRAGVHRRWRRSGAQCRRGRLPTLPTGPGSRSRAPSLRSFRSTDAS